MKTDYISAAGKTIARIKGTVSYMHEDHLGSAVASTTSTGAIAWREDYTPYGEKRVDPNSNKDDEGFTGHIDDAASGLTYMQARYYDPVIGRFLSNDPVGFAEGGVGYFNRYAYTLNNPVNATDPTGEAAVLVCAVPPVSVGCAATVKAVVSAGVTLIAILTVSSDTPNDPVEEVIEDAKEQPRGNGSKPRQLDKPGGNGVRTGSTSDGRSTAVYPESTTTGQPTVSIGGAKGEKKPIKIRYRDD